MVPVKPSGTEPVSILSSSLADSMDPSSTVGDVPVFADTNFNTHFAVQVSPDITAGNFKRYLEGQHFKCFPEIGNVRVHRLMVKRKSCFYQLPDALPIKHAFHGMKGTWFISMEAHPSERNGTGAERKDTKWKRKKRKKRKRKKIYTLKFVLKELFRSINLPKKTNRRKVLAKCPERKENQHAEERTHHCSPVIEPSQTLLKPVSVNLLKKNKRREMLTGYLGRKENVHVEERTHDCSLVATPSQTLSETVSVSGLIEKYFSGYDEVTSRSFGQFKSRTDVRCLNIKVDRIQKCAEKTPPAMINLPFPDDGRSGPLNDKLRGGKVGKAIVLASENVGICASKRKPMVSLCRFSEKKVSNNLSLNSSTIVKSLVFEINDEDDSEEF